MCLARKRGVVNSEVVAPTVWVVASAVAARAAAVVAGRAKEEVDAGELG